MKSIYDKILASVLNAVREYGMLSAGDTVLTAFSGGADSVALLLLLCNISEDIGFRVCAAHVNHGIRGKEADRDENFCRVFCERRGIPFACAHADIPGLARESGEGLEECARRIRYRELQRIARELGCNKIATAHHADDNIETVLLHMVRGCALNGLAGIPAVRGNIIRPLLYTPKRDITAWLDGLDIGYMHDSTNDDTEMSRNLLRHTVLPQLYKINPEADAAFSRLCLAVSLDSRYLEREAECIAQDADIEVLKKLDYPILSRYIKNRYLSCADRVNEASGERTQIDGKSIALIAGAIKNYASAVKYVLAGNITAYISSKGLFFYRENSPAVSLNAGYAMPLSEGENIMSSYGYRILITRDKNVAYEWQNIYKLSILMLVNSDRIINNELHTLDIGVRSRRAGDSYRFGGHERDIRRQLINYKIPAYKRNNLPCFTDKYGKIFWVPGLPGADGISPAGEGKESEKTVYIGFADENSYM